MDPNDQSVGLLCYKLDINGGWIKFIMQAKFVQPCLDLNLQPNLPLLYLWFWKPPQRFAYLLLEIEFLPKPAEPHPACWMFDRWKKEVFSECAIWQLNGLLNIIAHVNWVVLTNCT